MAADPRLKGQEVEIRVTVDGAIETTISSNIASFEETYKFDKKEDGFLGEVTNRYDDIFNGVDVKLEFQVNAASWMDAQQAIKSRSQRKTPGTVINVVRTDYYANGETVVSTYPDVRFGPQPTSVASRGDFVKVSWDFSCSDRDFQTLNGTL